MEEPEIIYKPNASLRKLENILGSDLSSKTPSLAYLNLDGVARFWLLLSVLSTPYIVWLLFKLKRYGWVASFFAFIVLPYAVGFPFVTNDLLQILLPFVPLFNLAIYLFLLKHTHRDWKEPMFINKPGSDFE